MINDNPYYYGSAENKLNSKGQVAIPARFRLAASPEEQGGNYVITRGEEECLYMYTHRQFARIKDNVRKMAEENDDSIFFRRFMAETHAVDLDTQGRFVLPQALMRAVGIKGPTLLFIGVDDRIEIWEPERYRTQGGDRDNYETTRKNAARRIFGI
ncbi:MAG: hypothetical protein LBT97_13660 [Planctomycetota bacterium]|jgi:MraZ protein|nr:hypothetical protein [Planctomycetota bacterium]